MTQNDDLDIQTTLKPLPNNWTQVLRCSAPFSRKNFNQVMHLLINEPNIVSPSVLRAEITSEAADIITRNLIPRQPDKDSVVKQQVTIQEFEESVSVEHIAINMNADELPFFYPKFSKFRYVFETNIDHQNFISIDVCPFIGLEHYTTDEKVLKIWTRILKHIHKFGKGFRDGYQKRVNHDLIVPKNTYQDLYYDLKQKYKHWVNDWTEDTDPAKFGDDLR